MRSRRAAGVRVATAATIVARAIGPPALVEATVLTIAADPARSRAVADAAPGRRPARAAVARARAAVVRATTARAGRVVTAVWATRATSVGAVVAGSLDSIHTRRRCVPDRAMVDDRRSAIGMSHGSTGPDAYTPPRSGEPRAT